MNTSNYHGNVNPKGGLSGWSCCPALTLSAAFQCFYSSLKWGILGSYGSVNSALKTHSAPNTYMDKHMDQIQKYRKRVLRNSTDIKGEINILLSQSWKTDFFPLILCIKKKKIDKLLGGKGNRWRRLRGTYFQVQNKWDMGMKCIVWGI